MDIYDQSNVLFASRERQRSITIRPIHMLGVCEVTQDWQALLLGYALASCASNSSLDAYEQTSRIIQVKCYGGGEMVKYTPDAR